ncbi:MAG: AmmeMemoRadiSam system radical SAM enzyme, partial [Planctomycetales bacterium]|nr:AmmeMemoRadiSam system radical SAM enzyme [Planctomycetales bacterium]
KSTGFCIDPIEKKPLNHFYPGTSVLSFGTAGCNLGCKFCQNWSISKSREVEQLSEHATPEMVATAATKLGCKSVAFTYNDPVIWAEYAIDTAKACHEVGIKTVAVTAAYITEQARAAFFEHIDAANVDLKAFSEHFYQQLTLSHLQPVLDNIAWLKKETDVWIELTNLIIPDENDGNDEFKQMCNWILSHIGDDVPIHFTAFHPDFKLQDRDRTPIETLLQAYDMATASGIKYVYVGNVNDVKHQSTYCPTCKNLLIERDWHALGTYNLNGNLCNSCGQKIAGHFEESPGTWGRKRQPVRISDYSTATNPRSRNVQTPTIKQGTFAMSEKTATRQNPNDVDCPELSDEQEKAALRAASEVVRAAVTGKQLSLSDPTIAGAADVPVFGCFVSIKRRGRLRGCCGFLGRRTTLLHAIVDSAKTSSVGDSRLPNVTPSELEFLQFEIWLLFGLEAIDARGEDRIAEVEIGKHGLQVQAGDRRGLLLPGVATDNGLDSEGFLRQVCMKANLPPTAWRDPRTRLARFQGLNVEGDFDKAVLEGLDTTPKLIAGPGELNTLADFCRGNIYASLTGAVPNYYAMGCSDGSVNGISLEVRAQGRDWPIRIAQVGARDTFPMQSSLQKACEAVGNQLRSEGFDRSTSFDLDLAVLYCPSMHGTVADPDLGGIDPQYRAVQVSQGAKSAWAFDPSKTPDELLQTAAESARVNNPDRAIVTSFVVQSNRDSLLVKNVPQPLPGPPSRPPAVAGQFYPGDGAQLSKYVDELTPKDGVTRKKWSAAMVPHAGLRFSGSLAADVLRRIEYPETVIVIGPKHTALGMDWSVAPHESWAMPFGIVPSDPDLAGNLMKAINGLELDALAHQREHSIEVELPFLHKFAPDSKVLGIVIGPATLEQCVQFATELADFLKDRIDDTLLVISTDMNHYATDEETRRVDEIAMQAIESLDPERVFNDVRGNDISMCGVLPAVIVMDTLKKLGRLNRVERVGYATSGDVSNDREQVVGYSGMLFA